jgi:curved DNA-binding protein CbpA
MHAYRPNHYEALGVPRNADGEAIRTTWRVQAKQLHPDLSEGGGLESNAAFLRLQEAYDVLRDPDRRAHYDATLARQAEAARRQIRPQPRTRPAAPNRTPKAAAAPSSVLRTAGWAASRRPSRWW